MVSGTDTLADGSTLPATLVGRDPGNDLVVNPGNSGGPLLNCQGEVIGINTLLENPTEQNVNVGVAFTVSINRPKPSWQRCSPER